MLRMVIDTETTGLPMDYSAPVSDSDNWPRMVQAAWIVFDDDKEISSADFIVKPDGFVVPQTATEIHGITHEQAMRDGVDLRTVVDAMLKAMEPVELLIAHNLDFDEKIIGAEFHRLGIATAIADKKRLCTMKASTDFCKLPGRRGYKWPSLVALHDAVFGEPIKGVHSAAADVRACANCYQELRRRGVLA